MKFKRFGLKTAPAANEGLDWQVSPLLFDILVKKATFFSNGKIKKKNHKMADVATTPLCTFCLAEPATGGRHNVLLQVPLCVECHAFIEAASQETIIDGARGWDRRPFPFE